MFVVRNASRKLKFGVQSRFYQISTVGFRTFFHENFGQAYYTSVMTYTFSDCDNWLESFDCSQEDFVGDFASKRAAFKSHEDSIKVNHNTSFGLKYQR